MTITMTTGEALIRRYYTLVDANDVDELVKLFQPGATYCRPGYPALVGQDEIREFYAHTRKFRAGAHTLTAVLDAGGRVAVHGAFTGEMHDGSRMDLRFADFFEVDSDGRFSRRDTYYFAPLG